MGFNCTSSRVSIDSRQTHTVGRQSRIKPNAYHIKRSVCVVPTWKEVQYYEVHSTLDYSLPTRPYWILCNTLNQYGTRQPVASMKLTVGLKQLSSSNGSGKQLPFTYLLYINFEGNTFTCLSEITCFQNYLKGVFRQGNPLFISCSIFVR